MTKVCVSVSKRLDVPNQAKRLLQQTHARPQLALEAAADERIHTIGTDHEIEVVELGECRHRAAVDRRNAGGRGARLQQLQQLQAADSGKTHAVDDNAFAAHDQRHVGPGFHARRNRRVSRLIVLAQEFECAVGEHHAEAEGGIRRILLDDRDVGAAATLDQIGKIEPGRTGAEDGDAHGAILQTVGLPDQGLRDQ